MATTPNPHPPLRDTGMARKVADPSGVNLAHPCGAFGLATHVPPPSVKVPVVNDHDADDRAGWAGVVSPVAGAPGESTR